MKKKEINKDLYDALDKRDTVSSEDLCDEGKEFSYSFLDYFFDKE